MIMRPCLSCARKLVAFRSHCVRLASSENSNAADTVIKDALRDLYRAVHPDFFHHHAKARAVNEKSFKLLQEYLAAAQSEHGPAAASPYRFHFFLKSSSKNSFHDEDNPTSRSQDLQEVSVLLPPPVPRRGPGRRVSPDTRKALSRLMTACGVAHRLGPEHAELGRQPLREFVPLAAEALHAAAATLPALRASEDAVRGALRLTRGVRASVSPSVPTTQRLDLLHALVAALERVQSLDLRSVQIVIHPGPSVLGASGTIELDAGAERPAEAWRVFLERDLDAVRCSTLRDEAQHMRQMERQAAARLGVAAVTPGRSLGVRSTAFRDFLHAVLGKGISVERSEDAQTSDVNGSSQQHDPTKPTTGTAENTSAHQASHPHVLIHVQPAGKVTPSIDPTARATVLLPADFQDFDSTALRTLLRRAEGAAAERQRALAELAGLAGLAERRLRLRKVKREDGIDDARYRACLQRLIRHSTELQPLLGGISVHIGLTNRVLLSQSALCIAWDFDI